MVNILWNGNGRGFYINGFSVLNWILSMQFNEFSDHFMGLLSSSSGHHRGNKLLSTRYQQNQTRKFFFIIDFIYPILNIPLAFTL